MELEDKVLKMIDEELEKLEKAISTIRVENEEIKVNIKNKETILQELDNIKEDNV